MSQTRFESLSGILQCPVTREPLQYVADAAAYAHLLPSAYRDQTLTGGYLNRSASCFYPVVEGIICLLPADSEALHDNVRGVQAFYEEYGWKRDAEGRYHDSALFIEQKSAVDRYYASTMARTARYLQPGGKYLLDVASGPVFQPENQALSAGFEKRICIDITFRALLEARRNLGDDRGIFIQGDITRLPLADGVCDQVMCVHTLYHVPRELQEIAVGELARVCRPGRNVVVLYNWAWHSWIMNLILLPVRVRKAFQRIYRYATAAPAERWLSGGLYFYPHAPAWFKGLGRSLGLEVSFSSLTSIHQDFVKYYVHDRFGGPALLRFVERMEEKYSAYLGRHGAFAFVVLRKKT